MLLNTQKIPGKTISIVGKNDGYAYKNTNCSILVKPSDKSLVTYI